MLAGGDERAFLRAVEDLNQRGDASIALSIADIALTRYPQSTAPLAAAR